MNNNKRKNWLARFEVDKEIAGWLIWDNERKIYISDWGDDEEGARSRCAFLNKPDGNGGDNEE